MATTQALVRRDAPGALLAPQTFQEALAFAERIANTDFVPHALRNRPGAVLAAIQYGAELGLPPMQAINSLTIINGNVGMKVELMVALIISHPECEKFERAYDPATKVASVVVKRRGRPERTYTFGEDDAARVPVKENDDWTTLNKTARYRAWPQRMYQARAAGFAIRDEFPDVIRGLKTAEEIEVVDGTIVNGMIVTGEPAPDEKGDAAWAWVPPEIQATVKEAFGLCALTPAKQRVLLFQYKDKGHDALIEYLRSEYATRHWKMRTSQTKAATPAAPLPLDARAHLGDGDTAAREASPSGAVTSTAASPPTRDTDPTGTPSTAPEADVAATAAGAPARPSKKGPQPIKADDIPWGRQ